MRLLLVEDDERLARNVALLLKRAAFAVDIVYTGAEAIEKAETEEYDGIVLDWMLPDTDGVHVLSTIRKQGIHTPVILLTARSMPGDVVTGLDTGADDYVTKPFDTEILLARIRSVLRRREARQLTVLTVENVTVDPALRSVHANQAELIVTPKEYAILEYLMIKHPESVSRMELISHVWDENANLFSNSVDVYVTRLRKKLTTCGVYRFIKTVKGIGYRV